MTKIDRHFLLFYNQCAALRARTGYGTKDQNQGLVRDVRALLRNCIFGITPDRDGM